MKRLLCAVCALMCLFVFAMPALAFSPDTDVSTQYVALVEANSGTLLYGKGQDDKAYPASTTKIMTCILALENGNLDDTVTCGNEVSSFGSHSSLLGLRPGEKITLRDLIYGMMLVSGNDAAAAIAAHISGSTDKFVELMNQKAAALNMTKTHWTCPEGRQNEEHYTTAADMAKLAIYAMNVSPKSKDFRAIVDRKTYTISPTNKNKSGYQLESSDRLIYTKPSANSNVEYSYAIGIKTGETNEAGFCLVSAAEKDGLTLILVQYKAVDTDSRFTLARQLFDWGFAHYKQVDASTLSLPTTVDVTVKNCSFDDETGGLLKLNVDLKGKVISCLSDDLDRLKSNTSAITTTVATAGDITAPVNEGDKLATVAYKFEGKTLFTADAYASRSVAQMGGGVVQTPSASSLTLETVPGSAKKSAGPWLFIILVAAFILVLLGTVSYLRRRKQTRRRRSRRVTYSYRGRR